jgi:hypothetical protein
MTSEGYGKEPWSMTHYASLQHDIGEELFTVPDLDDDSASR